MRVLQGVMKRLLGCAIAAATLGTVAAPAAAQESSTASLAGLIAQVRDADYRGDLTALEKLVARMEPYVRDPSLAGPARYWRGFALWRRALNAANDTTADAFVIERDFRMSASEFEEALALDSTDVESRIGLLSGLMNAAHFRYRRDAAEASRLMSRAMHEAERLLASAADNPRFVFVWAARLYWAPPDQGGDRTAAIRLIEQTLASTPASDAAHDPLKPNWGIAELHMQAAFFLSSLRPPDLARAEDHARTALEMHPQWSYVKDNLLPSIVERRNGEAAGE